MLNLQSSLRKGVSLGYVGLYQNQKDLKTTPVLAEGRYGLTPTILSIKSKSTKSTEKIDIILMMNITSPNTFTH